MPNCGSGTTELYSMSQTIHMVTLKRSFLRLTHVRGKDAVYKLLTKIHPILFALNKRILSVPNNI